ncbi:MAG: HNH nuclease family protein [Gammaproteobacteria bacterium]|nr:MAG: HNH nuclease family protein [Gammaproteobacteria bacterium]
MSTKNHSDKLDKTVAEARAARESREKGYREQALKLYPWVCGRCGREFNRQNLSQLTVHHRDHNHDNNPSDGSNWELLCLYCHDNEHSKYLDAGYGEVMPEREKQAATYSPFENLAEMMKNRQDSE